ncbi:MAG: hypothetical protein ABH882_04260 [Candidatus Omnitrophota bacterium]|nr:hypothetical protein [Candidatus Omnitrophota bacterium]MBU2034348.1 hypothetical protein [Candidatus Omnitrophota bacterium]MBU2258124.1 hypothetical protein [Candidatus Omnitrophota bacterium]
MDEEAYSRKQEEGRARYEALCRRCGACCGALDGDACVNLKINESGECFCSVYDHRIGMQKTVSGIRFACVPIRDLRPNLPLKSCVYFFHS